MSFSFYSSCIGRVFERMKGEEMTEEEGKGWCDGKGEDD